MEQDGHTMVEAKCGLLLPGVDTGAQTLNHHSTTVSTTIHRHTHSMGTLGSAMGGNIQAHIGTTPQSWAGPADERLADATALCQRLTTMALTSTNPTQYGKS